MRVMVPEPLTLTASTVAGSSYDEWSGSVAYSVGQRVKVTTAAPHKEYESLIGGNSGNAPATNPTRWLELGTTLPYRMTDETVSTYSEATSSIVASYSFTGRVADVALFGLVNVLTVTVEILEGDPLAVVATVTGEVSDDSSVVSWLTWLTEPFRLRESASLSLPYVVQAAVLRLTLTGETGQAVRCGNLVAGVFAELGATRYGAQAGMISFSRKEADEFGRTQLVRRPNAKRLRSQIWFPDAWEADKGHRLITSLDGLACVWDGNANGADTPIDALRVYGFVRDFDVVWQGHNDQTCSLEIDGLT